MRPLLRSEFLKIRTLRSFWWTAFAVLAAVPVLIASNIAMSNDVQGRLNTGAGVKNVFSSASSGLMLLVGIMIMAGEFRHGTAASTFLTEPNRARVVRAKIIVGALVGFAFAALASGVALAVGLPWLDANGVDLGAHTGDIAIALLGSFAATGLFALVGVGIGVLVRNQTTAIVASLTWLFVVESALRALLPGPGRWLPAGASAALSGAAPPNMHLLPMWGGALLFVAYGLAFAVAGIQVINRKDI